MEGTNIKKVKRNWVTEDVWLKHSKNSAIRVLENTSDDFLLSANANPELLLLVCQVAYSLDKYGKDSWTLIFEKAMDIGKLTAEDCDAIIESALREENSSTVVKYFEGKKDELMGDDAHNMEVII